MTPEQKAVVQRGLRAAAKLKREHKLSFYEPYAKQLEFHALGADHPERGLIAANRVGKSECAAAETAMHLTGLYPSWWTGRRFSKPIKAWAAGEDGELTRDVSQQKLCGPPDVEEDFGTGYIPKSLFVGRPNMARGTSALYDTIHVRHTTGGISTLTFKTYGEQRKGFQSATLDWLWFDEEPSMDIYSEGNTRTATTKGAWIITFTPMLGTTELVKHFDERAPGRAKVNMGIFDAGHFTKEEAEARIASYPPHERDARAYGVPMRGEGRVFLTDEALIKIERPEIIPPHWAKIWGIDFGGSSTSSHPFAAALLAWDRDYDIIYLLHVLRLKGMTVMQQVPKMRAIAPNTPVAWPHDGNEKDRNDGVTVANRYRAPMPGMPGLSMLPQHAQWPEGGFQTEPAVAELDDRCQTGRFKAVDSCVEFFEEYRQYHRDKGFLVKVDDDVLSAIFKALMMKRYARPGYIGEPVKVAGKYTLKPDEWWKASPVADDIDPFTGAAVSRDLNDRW